MILMLLLFLSWSGADALTAGSIEMAESEPSPTKLSVAGDTLEYPVDLQSTEREC